MNTQLDTNDLRKLVPLVLPVFLEGIITPQGEKDEDYTNQLVKFLLKRPEDVRATMLSHIRLRTAQKDGWAEVEPYFDALFLRGVTFVNEWQILSQYLHVDSKLIIFDGHEDKDDLVSVWNGRVVTLSNVPVTQPFSITVEQQPPPVSRLAMTLLEGEELLSLDDWKLIKMALELWYGSPV